MTAICASGWCAISATARGSAHATGAPNEDAAVVFVGESPTDRFLVAATADGHGSERHPRSATGARLAVAAVQRAVLDAAPSFDGEIGRTATVLRSTVVPGIIDHWRTSVDNAIDRADGTEEKNEARTLFGTTVAFAIAGSGWIALAQLGDGDILVGGPAVLDPSPLPADPASVAGATRSLADANPSVGLRLAVLPADGVDLVVVATDGYGNSFDSADWRTKVVTGYQALLASSGCNLIAEALPGWVEESAEVGGDDTTVAILCRESPDDTLGE